MDEHTSTTGRIEDAPPVAPVPFDETTRGCRGCSGIALGAVLVLIGIPMLLCPGPGMAVILSGLGMIAVSLGIKKTGA